MLTSLYEALVQKLSLMNLPVFLSDCVPEGTGFPCLTLEIAAAPLPREAGRVAMTIWCRGEAANQNRFRLMEELLDYMPARGFRVALNSGSAILRMNESAACVRSKDALGVKTLWTLHLYPST